MGVVRESSSPYVSPYFVVVKKKGGNNKVYVDYRKLNKLIVFDPESMPTADWGSIPEIEWWQLLF